MWLFLSLRRALTPPRHCWVLGQRVVLRSTEQCLKLVYWRWMIHARQVPESWKLFEGCSLRFSNSCHVLFVAQTLLTWTAIVSISTDGRIIHIPPVSQNTLPNPLLGCGGGGTAPPSTTGKSMSGVTQSTLAHQVLLYDQRCLVTGAVSSQLQACRLINMIRINKSNVEVKHPLKDEVVCSLPFLTCWAVIESFI